MARIPPSEIYRAWDEIVFQPVPWTTEERIHRWRPLYEQTWRDGRPVGDHGDAMLTITLGWGLYAELEDWESAYFYAKQGRALELSDNIDRVALLWHQAWCELEMDLDDAFTASLHSLMDSHRKYHSSGLHHTHSLIMERLQRRPPDRIIDEDIRGAAIRYLEIKRRKRDIASCQKAKTYGDLQAVKLFAPSNSNPGILKP